MNIGELLLDLAARGIAVERSGDRLQIDAPRGALVETELGLLREHKADAVRWLRLAEGLPVDRRAAAMLACVEVDPETVPSCPVCGRHCDTELMRDAWRCSRCDPTSEARRKRTLRLCRHTLRLRR